MTAWSYSSIKTFDQCPKKYFHLKVIKDVKDDPGEAAIYGTDAHEAAEHYIKHGTPIPEKFSIMRPVVEVLAKVPGEKHTELKLGVRKTDTGYEPCGFFFQGRMVAGHRRFAYRERQDCPHGRL